MLYGDDELGMSGQHKSEIHSTFFHLLPTTYDLNYSLLKFQQKNLQSKILLMTYDYLFIEQ